MRPYEEFNKKLQQLFVPLDQAEGKTVKKTEVDDDEAIIAWTDGTYSRIQATADSDCCEDSYQSQEPLTVSSVPTVVELGICSEDEHREAVFDWTSKRSEAYKAARLAEFNRLKQELGL